MRSNGQAFKPGSQDPVATPLCGVSAQSAVIADRGPHHSALAVERLLANGSNGMSDIEGKVAREAMSECGQRASFQYFRS